MTDKDINKLARALYEKLTEIQAEKSNQFTITYESEDSMIIDEMIDHLVELKLILKEYEENEMFNHAALIHKKIKNIESELEKYKRY